MTPESKQIYPLLERRLYSEFSVAFKKSVYDFVNVQANHKITGVQSLARRKIQSEVWQIDNQIVEIYDKISFLMLISPVNGKNAWKVFKKNSYSQLPAFHYRMIPDDPELLKRDLYNIQIEDIDDPTLGYLFREKRAETDKILTMLIERESSDFFHGSLQLFGGVSHKLLSVATDIMKYFPNHFNEKKNRKNYYDAEQFAKLAKKEFQFLQKQWPEIKYQVEIKNTIDSVMVDKGVLFIPANFQIRKNRAESLIQHEIGTHIVTYYNGKNQPLKLLSRGIPGFEELQEGIAVMAEYLTGGLDVARIRKLAGRVIAVDSLINHNNFIQTFELLTDEYGFEPRSAFFITTRVYRGGGLTKDAIYLNGFIGLIKYLKQGNPLEPLLNGKIRQNYIPVINELITRNILKPISVKPRYLVEDETLKRLSEIKEKDNITELVNTDL